MVEILRTAIAHPKTSLGLIATSVLVGGLIWAARPWEKSTGEGDPTVEPTIPVLPTQEVKVTITSENIPPTAVATPASTQVQNSNLIGVDKTANCVTTRGLPIKNGNPTPIWGAVCVGRGTHGESIWFYKGRYVITP